MLKDAVFPTVAEEFSNAAEILRELATQLHFDETRSQFTALAEMLEQQAALREQTRNIEPTNGATAPHSLLWGS
jgi:hypothetical protein